MSHSQVPSHLIRAKTAASILDKQVSGPSTPAPASFATPNPNTMPGYAGDAPTPPAAGGIAPDVTGAEGAPAIGLHPMSLLDKVKSYGAQGLDAAKGFANKEIAAGKDEINSLKPAGTQLAGAAQNYFKGLTTSPGQWAGAHPIGTGLALGGAALLLHHLLSKKKQAVPQLDGQVKTAASMVAKALGYGAGTGAAIVGPMGAVSGGQSLMDSDLVNRENATPFSKAEIQNAAAHMPSMPHSKAPAPVASATPVPGAEAMGVVDRGADAVKSGIDAVKSGIDTVGGWAAKNPGTAGMVGGGLTAAALLAYMLNRPSKKDREGQVPAAPQAA